MSEADSDSAQIAEWDPGLTKAVVDAVRPLIKRYFRSEVHGLDLVPPGAALVVSNHSGGIMQVDFLVFAIDFYDTFGYDRRLRALAHDVLFHGPAAECCDVSASPARVPNTPRRRCTAAPWSWTSRAAPTTCSGRR